MLNYNLNQTQKLKSASTLIPDPMLKILRIILLIFIVNFLPIENLPAQNTIGNEVAQNLMKIANSPKPISKKDYNDFWNSTGIKSREQKLNFILTLNQLILPIQKYNIILWDCAEKSWQSQKPENCEKTFSNLPKIKKQLIQQVGEENFKNIDDNFKKVINSSAKRKGNPNNEKDISDSEISLDKIRNAKLKSIQTLDRIDIILQPDYQKN